MEHPGRRKRPRPQGLDVAELALVRQLRRALDVCERQHAAGAPYAVMCQFLEITQARALLLARDLDEQRIHRWGDRLPATDELLPPDDE